VGADALAGASDHVARRQEDHPTGRRPPHQPILLGRAVARRLDHRRHAGVDPIEHLQLQVQILALRELWTSTNGRYKAEVYLLPKKLGWV